MQTLSGKPGSRGKPGLFTEGCQESGSLWGCRVGWGPQVGEKKKKGLATGPYCPINLVPD